MNQRLVWNFEFAPQTKPLSLKNTQKNDLEDLKWEVRLFWPDDKIIVLNLIDNALLNLANYQAKHREDTYYLLDTGNYNIKKRQDELLYKPLIKRTKHALGFGAKIKLGAQEQSSSLQELTQQALTHGQTIFVKKEAFVYKFATKPAIKIELARLEIRERVYFSICIEGKSQNLVETITRHLLGEQVSCEYVTFLKNIVQ